LRPLPYCEHHYHDTMHSTKCRIRFTEPSLHTPNPPPPTNHTPSPHQSHHPIYIPSNTHFPASLQNPSPGSPPPSHKLPPIHHAPSQISNRLRKLGRDPRRASLPPILTVKEQGRRRKKTLSSFLPSFLIYNNKHRIIYY